MGVFFAFLGFDMVCTLSEEAHQPQKTVPRAMMITITTACVLYVLVSLAFAALVGHSSRIARQAPLIAALTGRGAPGIIASLVALGAVGNTLTTVLASIVANPRILFKMSEDGLVPSRFGVVSPVSGIPETALFTCTGAAVILGAFFNFHVLADLVSVGALVAFTLVLCCAVELRMREERRFVDNDDIELGETGRMSATSSSASLDDAVPTGAVGGPSAETVGRSSPDVHPSLFSDDPRAKEKHNAAAAAAAAASEEQAVRSDTSSKDLASAAASAGAGVGGPSGGGPNKIEPSCGRELALICFGAVVMCRGFDTDGVVLWAPGVCLTALGILLLRHKWKVQTRPEIDGGLGNAEDYQLFRMPFMPGLPIFCIIVNCYLIAGLPAHSVGQSAVFILIGCAFYFTFGAFNSRLRIGGATVPVPSSDDRADLANHPA